ncbi:hypothetical protein E2562_010364 [Oryza meyeriana var. granulata]|uniref:Uncharacterized protein n=1 Tax=Oryza meyeriana var. granulata TaxID=110450 RepID=A0A6G1F6A7_9ORYZ|nr:hypothetical protein E2562_010364 [Oryza meyeriana var. granulata]
MGDGEGRTVVFKAVREAASVVPAVISEAPTKHFARHANAAMGLLSPVGEAANTLLLDLAAGALIPEPTINIEGTLIPKVKDGVASSLDHFHEEHSRRFTKGLP